ncbi:MAG: efflux RND transporter permease subunit, partial [Gammaproteobacteria bacterium]|nr:efflux RND transporter permease subunit [Gammaproteobacteria bacterium]
LKPKALWRPGMTSHKLREEFDRLLQIPGLTNAWVMPIKTRIDMLATGIKTPLGIKVAGPDLAVIQKIGLRVEQVLAGVPGTASVYAERAAGGRYIDVDIQRDQASRFGLNIDDIHEVIRVAVGGIAITETVEGLQRYPVNIRYPQKYRDSLETLKRLPIVTPQGARIVLADVARVFVADGPPVIKSENARPNGWIYVDIQDRDLGSYVADAQEAVGEQVTLPTGYSLSWSGQYEYLLRAQQRLALVGPVTLAIIVLLLFINFRHFAEVVIILGTLLMALVGGVWLLYLLDYDLSVAVGVGFIALAGVAVEIGVVMLVYLNLALADEKTKASDAGRPLSVADVRQAVISGALLRVRPIMMTVAAIIAGLLPIMLTEGTGSEVMRRIAAPMVGGMLSATVLTLIVIPALFLLWRSRTVIRLSGHSGM